MGRIVNLLAVYGGCAYCRQYINNAFCETPQDILNRHCPRCHLPLGLSTGAMVRAWQYDDGSCVRLANQHVTPPDLHLHERREECIRILGLGMTDAMGIRSNVLAGGLVRLSVAKGQCLACGRHESPVYLTAWQGRHLTCPACCMALHVSEQRELIAAPDGPRFWPIAYEAEPFRPLRQEPAPADASPLALFSMLDLELLGLK